MTTAADEAEAMTSGVTADLVDACLRVTRDGLPEPTRRSARLIALDTLGAMLAASDPGWPGARRMAEFVAGEGAAGPCLVVGTKLRTAPTLAALANGYLGYALDVESHHGPAVMHAAAAVLPAALAIAECEGADGAGVLSALTLGIEVACRVSLAIGPNDLYARGFHPTAVAGAFGAAAAGAVLLGLDRGRFANALGLAATQAGGLLAWASDHSEESRPFNPGTAARNGLTAARLAALGFGAPQGIFDAGAKYNVFRAWSLDGQGSPERLTDGIGERFAIEELTIKRFACCAFLHPALDGLLDLLAEGLTAERIAALTMRFPTSGAPIIDNNPLRSHRAQYILPVAAVRGRVWFADVLHDRSDEPEIGRLTAVTRLIPDDALDPDYPASYTTLLEATTSDGTTHQRRVEWPRGCPQNPMSEAEIVAKFRDLTEPRVGREAAEEIAAIVLEVDKPGRFGQLLERLAVE
jgi:2-methylcitrate dehydratase PrpD